MHPNLNQKKVSERQVRQLQHKNLEAQELSAGKNMHSRALSLYSSSPSTQIQKLLCLTL